MELTLAVLLWWHTIVPNLLRLAIELQQQGGATFSWEQLVLIGGVISSVGGALAGIFLKGVVRFGYQVDHEQLLLQGQIDKLQIQLDQEKEARVKQHADDVADGNARLANTIADYRSRLTDITAERNSAQEKLLQPMQLMERLLNVSETVAGRLDTIEAAMKGVSK